MESLFADTGVSCTHPGSSTVVGRKNVVNNWEFILEGIPKTIINRQILGVSKGQGVEVHLVLESFVADELTGEMSEVFELMSIYVKKMGGVYKCNTPLYQNKDHIVLSSSLTKIM